MTGASDTLDPIAAAEAGIVGSKHLIASVANDLSQQERWLAHYRVAEKRRARRVKIQEIIYRLELRRRRVDALVAAAGFELHALGQDRRRVLVAERRCAVRHSQPRRRFLPRVAPPARLRARATSGGMDHRVSGLGRHRGAASCPHPGQCSRERRRHGPCINRAVSARSCEHGPWPPLPGPASRRHASPASRSREHRSAPPGARRGRAHSQRRFGAKSTTLASWTRRKAGHFSRASLATASLGLFLGETDRAARGLPTTALWRSEAARRLICIEPRRARAARHSRRAERAAIGQLRCGPRISLIAA